MSSLKALLWDVDGTLADTERDGHRVAFNQAFSKAGLEWHWDVALYGKLLKVTGGKERIRYYLDQFNPDWPRPEDLEGFIAGLHKQKSQIYVDLMAQGDIPLRPGVMRLIREAAASGIRLAIVTTTTPANVDALLDQYFGAEGKVIFEVIAAGDVVPNKKPAPDIYQWALEQLDLPATACVALEDSHNGLRSALGAGVKTVLITLNEYTAHEDFSGASLVVDQLGEPNTPCHLIKGEVAQLQCVDVDLLKQLHGVF
ncbi:MAG: HAD family hydrolase [Sedimenticola sp.]|nr:HAD family hydrolase [Sedimenticola sp.]